MFILGSCRCADEQEIFTKLLTFDGEVCKWHDCPDKRSCGLQGCVKNHHRLLHNNIDARRSMGSQGNLPPLNSCSSNQETFRSDLKNFVPRNHQETSSAAGTSTACKFAGSRDCVVVLANCFSLCLFVFSFFSLRVLKVYTSCTSKYRLKQAKMVAKKVGVTSKQTTRPSATRKL